MISKKEPNAKKYIKKLVGAAEYINSKKRYCLWLVGVSPSELRKMPEVMKRVEACRLDRLNGAPDRQKLADTPTLFRESLNPDTFVIVPSVSSEKRKYVPVGFMGKDTISTNLNLIIPDATIYHFGILSNNYFDIKFFIVFHIPSKQFFLFILYHNEETM